MNVPAAPVTVDCAGTFAWRARSPEGADAEGICAARPGPATEARLDSWLGFTGWIDDIT